MNTQPAVVNEILIKAGLIDGVYEAMSNPDLSEVVMKLLYTLVKRQSMNHMMYKQYKSESDSTRYRTLGNTAYAKCEYQTALFYYNKALQYAPKNSTELKLAYSNRSALLHKVEAFSACIKDIETCFALGCPHNIHEKLKNRLKDASSKLWKEKIVRDFVETEILSRQCFHLKGARNPHIPCASADVEITREGNRTKVVANNDIKVGTVIAVETAFVSDHGQQNNGDSCYYCHKMDLNLQPCEGCCIVMFCNDVCRTECMKEFHNVECQIIDVLNEMGMGASITLSLKTLLKMKSMCTWNELIAASYQMGDKRMETSSPNEIYDFSHKFASLNVMEDKHFLYGPIYNCSFNCAFIVYFLGFVNGFYPRERNEAERAIARILMFLSLYSINVPIFSSFSVKRQNLTNLRDEPNNGRFIFVGKLKISCQANLLAVGLNKKIVLVAQLPIKSGTELTVSPCLTYDPDTFTIPRNKAEIQKRIFTISGKVCNCSFCQNDTNVKMMTQLTEMQRKKYLKLNLPEIRATFDGLRVPEIYKKVCKTLGALSDAVNSKEFKEVYEVFVKCIVILQDTTTNNVILDFK